MKQHIVAELMIPGRGEPVGNGTVVEEAVVMPGFGTAAPTSPGSCGQI